MTTKYFRVPLILEFEAENPEDARAMCKELRDHIIKTGGDSSLPCPENLEVGEAELVEEVEI